MSMHEKVIKTPELEIRVLANDIHIYKLTDWTEDGLIQWGESVNQRLNKATGRVLTVYDMRHLSTISRQGFTVATRLSNHPRISLAYSVAVINNRRVAILVNSMIQMRRNNQHNRIMSDMDQAIEWLTLKKKMSYQLKAYSEKSK